MIELRDYHYSIERNELFRGLNLTIERGSRLVLLGSNGSGKSTLLRILAGLYFGKGSYRFDGVEVNKKSMPSLRRRIGILFQHPDTMIFNPTVYDEIAFSLKIFGFDAIPDRVTTIARNFGIEHLLRRNPLQLSGGEKQKVMLASILAYEPELLLLDEPSSAMDPATTGWLIDLLLDLKITTLTATHDLAFAYESSDEALVLNPDHHLCYRGGIEELMKDLDLLRSANLIHCHTHRHKEFRHSHYHHHLQIHEP